MPLPGTDENRQNIWNLDMLFVNEQFQHQSLNHNRHDLVEKECKDLLEILESEV